MVIIIIYKNGPFLVLIKLQLSKTSLNNTEPNVKFFLHFCIETYSRATRLNTFC